MAVLVRATSTSSAATASPQTFTKPTGTVSGDLMLLHLIINGTTQPDTTPAGWTKLDEITGGGTLHQLWSKQAGGSEPASYDFTWPASISKCGGIVTLNSDAALPLSVNTFAQQSNAASLNRVCPSVTPTAAAQLVMFIYASVAQAMTPDALSTERYDAGAVIRVYCMTEAVSAGATGTRTATGASTATSKNFTVAVVEDATRFGAANLTLGALTLTATGTVPASAGANLSLAPLTLVATGTVGHEAAADLTLAPLTLVAAGQVTVTGQAALTLAPLTLTAAGAVPPPAPTALTATAVSGSRIDLSWAFDGLVVAGFEVERSPNGTTGWAVIATLGPSARSYSDEGLAANTHYWYRVRAFKA